MRLLLPCLFLFTSCSTFIYHYKTDNSDNRNLVVQRAAKMSLSGKSNSSKVDRAYFVHTKDTIIQLIGNFEPPFDVKLKKGKIYESKLDHWLRVNKDSIQFVGELTSNNSLLLDYYYQSLPQDKKLSKSNGEHDKEYVYQTHFMVDSLNIENDKIVIDKNNVSRSDVYFYNYKIRLSIITPSISLAAVGLGLGIFMLTY